MRPEHDPRLFRRVLWALLGFYTALAAFSFWLISSN